MKYTLSLTMILLCFISFGQSKIFIEAKVVVINPNDTLYIDVIALANLFKPEIIDNSSFSHGVRYLNNGENKGISASRIFSLEFIDTTRYIQKRRYINSRMVYQKINKESRPQSKYSTLIEEITTGHLSWYIEYTSNIYGTGIGKKYLFIKDGELNKGIAFHSFKKSLMKLMSNNPELVEKIKNTKFSKKPKEFQRQALNFINEYRHRLNNYKTNIL
ncbi:MAG: hypothetical protein QM503_14245 [Bacteroidota bacterium]